MSDQVNPAQTFNLQEQLDAYLIEFTDALQENQAANVKDYFVRMGIRTVKSQGKTFFCLIDIAKIIDDQNYKIFKSDSLVRVSMKDAQNHTQVYKMLDETGLYEYLMKSKRPNAKPFQRWMTKMNELVRINNDAEKSPTTGYVNLSDILAKLKVDVEIPADVLAKIKDIKIPLEEITKMIKQE